MGNPVEELARLGQCVWVDYLSRELITSGELARLAGADGVSGVTSNPTIFHKAMSGSGAYDDSLKRLLHDGYTDHRKVFFRLAFEDVSAAADILRPAYEASKGRRGFVSIEVSPDLAHDTQATIAEARWIFSTLGRKNIMVKVPATEEGIPAIEQLTADGVNVNVTLLFSVNRYAEVAEAFMRGLEKRVSRNYAISEIASVASFFVSRVDTLVDRLLDEKIAGAKSDAERGKLKALRGRAAVANAKAAYLRGEGIKEGERFKALAARGARWQRLLWGSSGTKNPAYSYIKYVQELIGPDTVNTMPIETLRAFIEHGEAKATIADGAEEAAAFFAELRSAGIDMEEVARELEEQGVRSFADSHFALLEEISKKMERLRV